MNPLKKIAGSRYRKDIPYAYEATIDVVEGDCTFRVSYLGDTVCGLTDFLSRKGELPAAVELFELFRGSQAPIPKDCYLSETGDWLPRAALCKPMTARYNETGRPDNCPFCDRKQPICGPC